MLKMLFNG